MRSLAAGEPALIGILLVVVILGFRWTRCAAEPVEISYTNSYDGTEQLATAFVPEICTTREDNPLIVLAHPAGGTRHSMTYYYEDCESRGWLMVIPDLHGSRADGRLSWAAIEAQHDLIDAVAYMRSHYSVDPARIYLAGRSMGGCLAAVTAAKYPDLFAAVMAGQGIYDMIAFATREDHLAMNPDWTAARTEQRQQRLEELGGPPSPDNRFTYERQSAISYAPNFQYVPLLLWHGTNDMIVPPEQSESLVAAIREHNRFQPDVHWMLGAPHNPLNYPPAWIMDQLQHYSSVHDWNQPPRFFPELHLVIDEAKSIFWLYITPARKDAFAEVRASVTHGELSIQNTGASRIRVDLGELPDWLRLSTFTVETDGPLHLSILRDDSELFAIDVEDAGSGPLPEMW